MLKSKISIFIIFLVWFLFSLPYLFFGKVPFPSSYMVNNFAPWSHYEKYWGPVKNGAMPDIITQIYPWKHLTIETIKKKQIPFWNPYNFSGNPHLADFQTAVFSPFNLLFLFLPFILAWTLIIVLQPLIAGISTFAFLRSLGVSGQGSTIGSITFMFCGFMVVWMAYGTLSMVIAFLPLVLLAIEKIFKKPTKKNILFLSLSIVLSLFFGHFQTSLYLLLFSFIYFMFKFIVLYKRKESIYVFLGFLFGIILSLPQLIPSIHLYMNSVRSIIFNQSGGIPFYYLVTIFSPDFFGNPVTRNDWFGFYAEWSSFVGIIPLTLAFFLFQKTKNKILTFFTVSSVIILLLALDSPLQKIIGFFHIPVISTSNPSRIIVLFSFCLSVLASFGFDQLIEKIKNKTKMIYLPFLILGLLLSLIWILIFFHILVPDKTLIATRNLVFPTVLFICFGAFVIFSKIHKNKNTIIVFSFLTIILVSFDSLRFAQKWMPYENKNVVFQDLPIIKEIKKDIGFGRIYGNLGTEVNTYYGIPSIEGYDPLYIGRYGEFIESAENGTYKPSQRSVVRLSRRGKYTDRVLDLLGVFLVFHPIADTNQGWAYPVWENNQRYSLLFKDNKFEIFKNNNAMNRVELFYNYQVVKENKSLIARFYQEDFDFRNILLLEEDPHISFNFKKKGNAYIASYTPNKVLINVSTDSPALLFLSDNFYPAWKAIVNEKPAKIYRADYSFRAIVVPSGESKVEFVVTFY